MIQTQTDDLDQVELLRIVPTAPRLHVLMFSDPDDKVILLGKETLHWRPGSSFFPTGGQPVSSCEIRNNMRRKSASSNLLLDHFKHKQPEASDSHTGSTVSDNKTTLCSIKEARNLCSE